MAGYFLSYARADQHVALPFADAVRAAGVTLWVDQYDITPSQHWDSAVEAALRASEGVIILLSPRSAASSNVADEISVAVDARKHLIPVMIEACTPPLRLTRVQFIDATRDRPGALARCLAAIRGGAMPSPAPPAVPPPPPPAALPEAALGQAEQTLTTLMGPIAGTLVRRAAAKAGTLGEFHAELAARLPEAERARFLAALGSAPPPTLRSPAAAPGAAIPPEALAALATALTPHLGPIAQVLVQREQATASSREALRQKLAARIPEGPARAAFLNATK